TPSNEAPLTSPEIAEWRTYLLDSQLAEDEPEASLRRIDLSSVPDPSGFADLVAVERAAITADEQNALLKNHTAFTAMSNLDGEVRSRIQQRLRALAEEADNLTRRCEAWMTDALADVRSSRAGIWQSRARQIGELVGRSSPLIARLGVLTEVTVAEGDLGPIVALATGLREHLATGNKLKTGPDGRPKIGALTAKPVKQAQPLFDRVRVNQLPPTTIEQLDAFLIWVEVTRSLAALDRSWPENVRVRPEDTLQERLQWHTEELKQLHRILQLGAALDDQDRWLAGLGLPRPVWSSLEEVRTYARLVDVAAVQDARTAAAKPMHLVEETVEAVARWADAAPCVQMMLSAVRSGDYDSYASAHARVQRLVEVSRITERRDELAARLRTTASALAEAVEREPHDASWAERLAGFEKAWAWASAGAWVAAQERLDINVLQAEVTLVEKRIRDQVETLAATRAWSHAVSPDRLTGQARADLQQYADLVRRLGKGTGVYADQRRAEIRQAMDRCRPAVPVWIMPIYRIAEQFRIQPDMFDVVIVDEASQAGLEATFLQYMAPKMVVIGDDRQVSPAAVGVNQQQLRDLAVQYLPDDRYRASWQDPQRSLFDEAKMRYRGLLTLTEHRRCVPEIIGFSNRIAYEPDGIRLIPVRQYGIDRLEPIKTVFLPEGHVRGTKDKINPVELDAIVNQIEKCVADPRYDGLTFGVISLLGDAQAKAIEKVLLDLLPPEEWSARQLRCGDSADFQGSERDVMFLSMVAASEPGRPMVPLTRDLYVQRYNVAAS
ncbi:MAG TPA: AAA family ATPase, partial [Amycolatopsis sp.]|nr:AAA family ATPase [Amycolatopsis sp.]